MQNDTTLSLVFHTQFNEEFSGPSPEAVVEELYQNSRKGMDDISFEDWWEYQRNLWKQKYNLKIPDHDTEGASQAQLDVLVEVGALEKSALPESTTQSRGLDVG